MITLLDWETTGLTLHPDAALGKQPLPIEFGGVKMDPSTGEIVDELSQLINPGCEISAEITKITGITNEQLVGQPTFEEFLPTLRAFFTGSTCVVAHNLPFDKAITMHALARLRVTDFPWPEKELCTVGVYKETWGRNPRLLELYADVMGRPLAQTHRALDDVKALAEIFQKEELWQLI